MALPKGRPQSLIQSYRSLSLTSSTDSGKTSIYFKAFLKSNFSPYMNLWVELYDYLGRNTLKTKSYIYRDYFCGMFFFSKIFCSFSKMSTLDKIVVEYDKNIVPRDFQRQIY